MPQTRTAQTIVDQALRTLGAIATGETPTSDERSDGLDALQDLIASWSIEGLLVYALNEREELTLTADDNYYTIGSGGDFDTTRPVEVVGAMGKGSSGVEYHYKIINHKTYRDITLKSTGSIPYWLYYNPNYPLGEIRLYPTPTSADTLYLDSIKPLTEPSALTSNVQFPEGYNRALRYNLAIDLAPEYGQPLTPALLKLAKDTKDALKRQNAKWKIREVRPEIFELATQWSIEAC